MKYIKKVWCNVRNFWLRYQNPLCHLKSKHINGNCCTPSLFPLRISSLGSIADEVNVFRNLILFSVVYVIPSIRKLYSNSQMESAWNWTSVKFCTTRYLTNILKLLVISLTFNCPDQGSHHIGESIVQVEFWSNSCYGETFAGSWRGDSFRIGKLVDYPCI